MQQGHQVAKNYDSGVTILPSGLVSPDGTTIYRISNGQFSELSTQDGSELRSWSIGVSALEGLSVSNDGRYLAGVARGATVFNQQGQPTTSFSVYRIDTASGANTHFDLPISAGQAGDTAILADGTIVVSTSDEGLKLISATGVLTFVAGTSALGAAVLSSSADGLHVLAGETDRSTTVISQSFSYQNNTLVSSGTTSITNENIGIFGHHINSGSQAISHDGSYIAQAYLGIGIDVYNGSMDFIYNLLSTNSRWYSMIIGLAFDSSGEHLFVLSDDSGTISKVSIGDWRIEARFALQPNAPFWPPLQIEYTTDGNSLILSPDGKFAYAANSIGIEKIDLHFFGGTADADTLNGTSLGDTFNGRAGNDTIDGGAGLDVAAYAANRADATVSRDAASHALTITTGLDGADTVRNVEQVHFADGLYSFQFASASTALANFGGEQGWTSQASNPRQLVDVNGDGKLDIVGFGHSAVRVALGNGNGTFQAAKIGIANFGPAQDWDTQDHYPRVLADVNGDGRADIVGFGYGGTYVALGQADGTFSAKQLALDNFGGARGWNSEDANLRLVADVNGDGKADIVGFGYSAVRVALGNGDGTFQAASVALADMGTALGWTSQDATPRQLADVNGDGKLDIVGFGGGAVFTALGNGDGTFQASHIALADMGAALGWTSQSGFPRLLADVNGDGRADIVGFGYNGASVALANADGTFNAAILAVAEFGSAQGWTSQDSTLRYLADINHDDHLDIVGFGPDGTMIAYGLGDGSFTEAGHDLANFGNAQGWTSDNTYLHALADLNGDGLTDIVGFGFAGVKVAMNQGDVVL